MSTTAGSSSKSTSISAAMSSASARVSATQAAIASPTWRTLFRARQGCSEGLKPGRLETARIGFTPARSAAVNTASRHFPGIWMSPMRAWASGLRRNATSFMPGSLMSATNWPRPRR